MEIGRKLALFEMSQKAIYLEDGSWTKILFHTLNNQPKIKVKVSFNKDSLLLIAIVTDKHFKDRKQAWRYGDGFLINFVLPKNFSHPYSNNFHAFGFSLKKGEPTTILLNKDGKYYLKSYPKISPQISFNELENKAIYKISLPWSALYPFNPLIDKKAGINIRYISRNNNKYSKTIKYIQDGAFDSENSRLRRYAPLFFNFNKNSELNLTGRINDRLTTSRNVQLKIALWSVLKRQAYYTLKITNRSGETIKEEAFKLSLLSGLNIFNREVILPEADGLYKINLHMNEQISWSGYICKYNNNFIPELKIKLKKLRSLKTSPSLESSIDGLTYHLNELKEQIATFDARKDLKVICKNLELINELFTSCQQKRTIYNRKGYLLSAFKSSQDYSLQPFSIYLPDNFDPLKQYPLTLVLHDSGVDEVGFLHRTAGHFRDQRHIIIAPRGRNLYSWYMGKTEADIVDLIKIVKRIFKVKKTYIYGFSMGGYGAWRMSLLHPDLFDYAICVSAPLSPWRKVSLSEDIRKSIGKGKKLKYLVIHGIDDHADEIQKTDQFVNELNKNGYLVRYLRVKDGGHNNFNPRKMIKNWLKWIEIDNLLNKYDQNQKLNGNILVSNRGNIIYKKAFGLANAQWNIKNTIQSKFPLFSITKQLTSLITLQLLQEKKLHLMHRISKYLDYYRKKTGKMINIHHLLTHTHGLAALSFDILPLRIPPSTKYFLNRYGSGKLQFKPGSKYQFSPLIGFTILTAIIEQITGKPYEEVLQERIFIPLKMKSSGYIHLESTIPQMTSCYLNNTSEKQLYFFNTPSNGATSIYSTIDDLYTWNKALLGNILLKPKYTRLMFTPNTARIKSGKSDYCYGGLCRELKTPTKNIKIYIQTGGDRNISCIIPEDNHQIIFLSNTEYPEAESITLEIIKILYNIRD
jgi:CubicO group peptidase (beta-lactamase class C family)